MKTTSVHRHHRVGPAAAVAALALLLTACLPLPGGSSGGSQPADQLPTGVTLSTGASLTSPNGLFFLVMQGDGNLVEYMHDGSMTPAVWSSGTWGQGPSYLVMQGDGNLVIYRNGGGSTWASGYAPAPGAPVASGSTALPVNSTLLPGTSLDDAGWTLTMNADGTFTATIPSGQVEPAGTLATEGAVGNPGAYLDMEPSGNLVEQTPQGQVVWQAGTAGFNQCLMANQSTGTPVVRMPGWWWTWNVWSVTPCYMGGWMKPTTAFIGDSITLFSQGAIQSAIGTSMAYTISGEFGWNIPQQMAGIDSALSDPEGAPSNVVINLGTNDATGNNTNWQSDYNAMVSAVEGRSCVILVTINTFADVLGNDNVATGINAAEQATVATHPNFHLIDWNGFLNQGSNRSTMLISDGIHPNGAGAAALAQMYMSALTSDCGA